MKDLQHEAMDRAHVIEETLQAHVRDHPFVAGRPDLVQATEHVIRAVGDLYQAIGRAK